MKARAPLLRAALLLALVAPRCNSAQAEPFGHDALRTDFVLVNGRPSACPQRLTISGGSATDIPASATEVDGVRCSGGGATLLAPGEAVLRAGLPLPAVLTQPTTRFLAGVDTAARTCGRWAFNASSVTWFIANVGDQPLTEPATGTALSARRAHVVLTALADACVMQATSALPDAVRSDDEAGAAGTSGQTQDEYTSEIAEHESAARPPAACFPGDATVRVAGGETKRMRDLRVGESVLVRDGAYSKVFALSHGAASGAHTFVRFTTERGSVVDVTEGHVMLERQRGTAVAGALRVGDELAGAYGNEWQRISRVEHVRGRGLYNPHTISGEIVVDGVLATTWTSAVPAVTATCALAPLRWWFRVAPHALATATGSWLLPAIEAAQAVVSAR